MCWIDFRDVAARNREPALSLKKRFGHVVVQGSPIVQTDGVGLVDAGQSVVFWPMQRNVHLF